MANPILIIDFGLASVRAGIIAARQGELKWSSEIPVHPPAKNAGALPKDNVAEALSALLQTIQLTGFRRFSRILVGLPPAMMSLRIITLPFRQQDYGRCRWKKGHTGIHGHAQEAWPGTIMGRRRPFLKRQASEETLCRK